MRAVLKVLLHSDHHLAASWGTEWVASSDLSLVEACTIFMLPALLCFPRKDVEDSIEAP